MMFRGRNAITIEFIEILKNLLSFNYDTSNIEINNRFDFITLDGIKGSARIEPEVYFCFSDENEENMPDTKMMLGCFYASKLILDDNTKAKIIQ